MKEVLKGAVASFFARALGALATLLFNWALARILGTGGSGVFFLALTLTTVASVLCRAGMDHSILRLVATAAGKEDTARARDIYLKSLRIVLSGAVLVALGLWAGRSWLAERLLGEPVFAEVLGWMALSIVPVAIYNVSAQTLQGLHRILASVSLVALLTPLLAIPLVLLLAPAHGAVGAAAAYLIAATATAVLGLWFVLGRLPRPNVHCSGIGYGELCRDNLALFLVAMLQLAIAALPTLWLSALASPHEVGVFSIANRLALLLGFVSMTVNGVVAQRFAVLHEDGNTSGLAKVARESALLMTVAASPLVLALAAFPGWVMSLFGSGFEGGSNALVIMVIGQFAAIVNGSVAYLLVMSGHARLMQAALVIATGLSAILCAVLVPSHGMIGAAIANAVSVAAVNVTAAIFVKLHLGFVASPFFRARPGGET